jgi:outer membrane receptor for ferrienterochelin and colicins
MLFRILLLLLMFPILGFSQAASVKGVVKSDTGLVSFASVGLVGTNIGTNTNEKGVYRLTSEKLGKYTLRISAIGYKPFEKIVVLKENESLISECKFNTRCIGFR